MDAWSPEQLKKMQLGGNDALNAFFKNYGVDKYTEIRDKYNTQAAEVVLHCNQLLRLAWVVLHVHTQEHAFSLFRHPLVQSTVLSNPVVQSAVLPRQNQGRN